MKSKIMKAIGILIVVSMILMSIPVNADDPESIVTHAQGVGDIDDIDGTPSNLHGVMVETTTKIKSLQPNGKNMGMSSISIINVNGIITSILGDYQTDLDLMMQCMNDYIAVHGSLDENFALPSNLQLIFDEITNEISENNQINSLYQSSDIFTIGDISTGGVTSLTTSGGGITKAEGPYQYMWAIPPSIGIYWNVWLSDSICRQMEGGGLILYILLGALGLPGVILALYLAANHAQIIMTNVGNGVMFGMHIQYIGLAPTFFIWNCRSQ